MDPYRNLPTQLAHDGVIRSSAYSIWLDDLDSNSGSLLFGGVDHARYTGDLVTMPILRQKGSPYSSFFVTMTGLKLGETDVAEDDNMALAVVLDSGTSFTYLPNDMAASIYDAVGAVYSETEGIALVPCSLANENTNLTFYFNSPARIDVAMSELVLDSTGEVGSVSSGEEQACLFGIAPSLGKDTPSLLGDTFLRSAYVVFDMENNEISIAQSNFDAEGSDISEIGTGDNAVPSATQAGGDTPATSGLPEASGSPDNDDEDDGVGMLRPCIGGVLASLGIIVLGLLS
jgi:hypothetical protein